MLTITVGLIFFYNGDDTIDFRAAHLLRDCGHPKVRHMSIVIVSLAFLYHGLNIFISRELDVIKGSNNILQAQFLKRARPQASQLKTNEGHLMVEYCQQRLQKLNEDQVVWDYFDWQVTRLHHTFHSRKGYLLLRPFFTIRYHLEMCIRQISQSQREIHEDTGDGMVVGCELGIPEWYATYFKAQYLWNGFLHLPLSGPAIGKNYTKWWSQVCSYIMAQSPSSIYTYMHLTCCNRKVSISQTLLLVKLLFFTKQNAIAMVSAKIVEIRRKEPRPPYWSGAKTSPSI